MKGTTMKKTLKIISLAMALALPPAIALAAVVEGRNTSGGSTPLQVDDYGVLAANADPAAVFASAARTATANSTDQVNYSGKGVVCLLDITAASGTSPTLDIKLQYKDTVPATDKYIDIPSATFAQKTAAGTDSLTIYPGIAETANRSVSDVLPRDWRAVATIGGTSPSFTFSLACTYIN